MLLLLVQLQLVVVVAAPPTEAKRSIASLGCRTCLMAVGGWGGGGTLPSRAPRASHQETAARTAARCQIPHYAPQPPACHSMSRTTRRMWPHCRPRAKSSSGLPALQ